MSGALNAFTIKGGFGFTMDMRRKDRHITQADRILSIIDGCSVCRIAMQDGEGLYIVPLSFGYEYSGVDNIKLYFHSANEGRKLRAITARPDVAFEMDCMEGITQGDTACAYSCAYKSITGTARASIVCDTEEKQRALSLIMEHTAKKHFDFNSEQAAHVAIIRLDVKSISAKGSD